MTTTNETTQCWHWPDHTIGKRESRRLREEHNQLVNSHAELLTALQTLFFACRDGIVLPRDCAHKQARTAIAKATNQ